MEVRYYDIQDILGYSLIKMESNIKKHVFWQPWLDTDDNNKSSNSTKQLPTTKWKRDRRSRLPEYSRKSDPKLPENTPPELLQQAISPPTSPIDPVQNRAILSNGSPEHTPTKESKQNAASDAPIDMTVRQRGLPPSYSQTINNPGYRSNYRPSVITQAPPTPPDVRMAMRNDLPSGISMCDPIIDEHFRRSLGKDYLMLFSNNNKNTEAVTVKTPEKINNTTVKELIDMDNAGLSVDDHFAKALGDTWFKLNQKDSDIKTSNPPTEKQSVVSL